LLQHLSLRQVRGFLREVRVGDLRLSGRKVGRLSRLRCSDRREAVLRCAEVCVDAVGGVERAVDCFDRQVRAVVVRQVDVSDLRRIVFQVACVDGGLGVQVVRPIPVKPAFVANWIRFG
jgi:hypothetical protein